MHICQNQKLLESYDYNIINYVMVINFFIARGFPQLFVRLANMILSSTLHVVSSV